MIWKKRSIQSLSKTEYDQCLALMEPLRRERVLKMSREDKRCATVLGEWMAKNALSDQCGIPLEEISLKRTERGKPYAEGLTLHFSISHSGDFAAVAVSDRPIGIDIEVLRPADPRLSQRIGAEPNRFFEEWTAKEAHFKIYGDPNFKAIPYNQLTPLHFYEDNCIITIIEKEK